MVTKELVVLIKKRREDGMSDEQIHALLENSGYVEDDIVAAIDISYKDFSSMPTEAESHKIAAQSVPKKKGWWPF